MATDRFQKGLSNILAAFQATLAERGVEGAIVTHVVKTSEPAGATFTVSAGGMEHSQDFAHEEILDSGDAVDAPVALKMRMLVSHFIR
jgi:hypothetical protein